VRETIRHFALDALEASEHDVMHGAALAAAETARWPPGAPRLQAAPGFTVSTRSGTHPCAETA
jgi:hypothetical protein